MAVYGPADHARLAGRRSPAEEAMGEADISTEQSQARQEPRVPSPNVDSRRPGDAYYEGMKFQHRGERIAAWRRDLEAVKNARYPRISKSP